MVAAHNSDVCTHKVCVYRCVWMCTTVVWRGATVVWRGAAVVWRATPLHPQVCTLIQHWDTDSCVEGLWPAICAQ